jgi:hypothetical protein
MAVSILLPSHGRQRVFALALLFVAIASVASHPATPDGELLDLPVNITDRITFLAASPQTERSNCGSEGQWNCMTDRWQRCASGKWSVIMRMSTGTVCVPEGLTNDFRTQASTVRVSTGGTSSRAGGGVRSSQLVWTMVGLCITLGLLL